MTKVTNPRRYVWRTVAELEREKFTRQEIAEALREVADSVEPEHA